MTHTETIDLLQERKTLEQTNVGLLDRIKRSQEEIDANKKRLAAIDARLEEAKPAARAKA